MPDDRVLEDLRDTGTATLDHVLVGAPDLDQGRDRLAALTGVRPKIGGEHPQWGSHNALLALGPESYLELVALQPTAPARGPFAALRQLTGPTPIGWALATRDLEATRRRLKDAGFALTSSRDGGRERPDGSRLTWRTMAFVGQPMVGSWPFFIEWAQGAAHPAAQSPAGCGLSSWQVRCADPGPLASMSAALGLTVDLAVGTGSTLVLDTPRGVVTLS